MTPEERLEAAKAVEELKNKDLSDMTLGDVLAILPSGVLGDPSLLMKVRLELEDQTGIPMEEDEMGEQEDDLAESEFPELTERIAEASNGQEDAEVSYEVSDDEDKIEV